MYVLGNILEKYVNEERHRKPTKLLYVENESIKLNAIE